jgi:O-antigen/teichoic acid export membrane protein
MTVRRNLAAALGSSIWAALLALAVVPLYLHYLGIEAYGLIGFFSTLQALFQILDLGMAPTINREIARCSATGGWSEARRLLHTLGILYWTAAIGIALLMVALAPAIAAHWLNPKGISQSTVVHAVMLMGLVVACRWPIGLYQGALNGMHRLAVSSGINAIMITLSTLGAVGCLALISPTVDAFFVWQGIVGLGYALAMRWTAWRIMGRAEVVAFDGRALRSIWRFSASMMALTLAGVIFAQLDKVLLSKFLGLEAFGRYTLASVAVAALGVFVTPFYNAVYPRFCAYFVHEQLNELFALYRSSGRLLAAILFSIAMVLAVFSEDAFQLWTRNPELAHATAPLASLLAIGTAVHGVMYIPHALQLAFGKPFIPLMVNLTLLVVMVPVTIYFAMYYGAFGGALAWLLLHTLYAGLSTWLTDRYIGHSAGVIWFFRDVGIPFLFASGAGIIGIYAVRSSSLPAIARLAVGCFLGVCSAAASIAVFPSLRADVFAATRRQFSRRRGFA